MGIPKRILVFRFSAMGDVAMSASILRLFAIQYPTVEWIVVSKPPFKAFFKGIPNCTFIALDAKNRHKGMVGLFRLYRELHHYKPQAIADLHDNLRSRILSTYFRLSRPLLARIDKGRKEKKQLTRKLNKQLVPLRPMTERYADVFRKLGLSLTLSPSPHTVKQPLSHKIGIAPFAQHAPKVYPLDKMEQVVKTLSERGFSVYIFGGGRDEQWVAEEWEKRYPQTHSLINKVSLEEELAAIGELDIMVSMDSAGMHMASLMGVPAISTWGATHPFVGFLGYGQQLEDAVQVDLYCRPCSVFGNIPCYRGDHACMHRIDTGMIIAAIEKRLFTHD